MDTQELLDRVPINPSDRLGAAAAHVIAVFQGPTYVDAYDADVVSRGERPTVSGMLVAAAKDGVEMAFHLQHRKASYELNRALGLSRAQALFSASPATGLAVASVVENNLSPTEA